MSQKECPKCKQLKDNVGPKVVEQIKDSDSHRLLTKILCEDCCQLEKERFRKSSEGG